MKVFQDPTAITWLGLAGLILTKAVLLFIAYRLMPSDRKPATVKAVRLQAGE